MASTRQQIVSAVIARMKTILVSNGYNTNLGNNVFDWKTSDWETQEMPGLTVEDGSNNTEAWTLGNPRTGMAKQTLNLEVLIKVESGTTPASTLRGMIADVVNAMGQDITLGLLNVWTEQDKDESLLLQDKNVISGARVGFKIHYLTHYLSAN